MPRLAIAARTAIATCAIALSLGSNNEPPKEFRIFVPGWNDTENGRFLFDDEAAASVMAAHAKWGVDVAIDLEHQMLDDDPSPDPTSKDARGWCGLELRNGELWAVSVSWTEDGDARLRGKRQRYVSPAFHFDAKTRRVTQIINVAITGLPATHHTPALVAARRAALAAGAAMDPKLAKEAFDVIEAGDGAKALEILKGMVVSAASGDTGAPDPAADPPVENTAAPDEGAGEGETEEDEDAATMAAARTSALEITGKKSVAEAMAELSRRSKIAVDLETREAKLAADRVKLETSERRALCGRLVTEAGKTPATVWADDTAAAPKKYLATMSIEELREHVTEEIKAAKASGRPIPKVPARTATTPAVDAPDYELTAEEIALCKSKGIDQAKYAATRAAIRARSNHAST